MTIRMDPSSPSGVGPRHNALETNKSEIISDLNHELRSLLGGIIGINELLLTTEQTAHQRQLAQTIEQSSKTLLTVLSDICDLSRFESGKVPVESEPVDVSRMAMEIKEQLSYMLINRQIDFQTQCISLPAVIFADAGHLRRIVQILVAQGLRCLSNGTVRLVLRGENETENSLDLSVSVTVSPIAEHDQLFLSTLSEPMKPGRKFDSRWLGFYLCVCLVDLLKGRCGTDFHGSSGTLWVKLRLGKRPIKL